MPCSRHFRQKIAKILDFCELCKIRLVDLHNNKIMQKKFTKSFKTLHMFDMMKSGFIKKVSAVLLQNKFIKFDINEQG